MACGAEVVKFYDYEGHLDTDKRAQSKDYKHWSYVTEADFRVLQGKYDAKAYDGWVKKLAGIREGMTQEEIERILKAEATGLMVGFGSGITATFILDHAYFIGGLFDYDGKLIGQMTHPIAITYAVRYRNFLPGERANPTVEETSKK